MLPQIHNLPTPSVQSWNGNGTDHAETPTHPSSSTRKENADAPVQLANTLQNRYAQPAPSLTNAENTHSLWARPTAFGADSAKASASTLR